MAKDYAEQFYSSTEWKAVREAYKHQKSYLCEKCGRAGVIVHHIKHITPDNINDPEVTLNPDNLCLLCRKCHSKVHSQEQAGIRYFIDPDGKVMITEK